MIFKSHQRAGVGSLFSGIHRKIKPLSKSTIENSNKEVKKDLQLVKKTVKKETVKTARNPALQFLGEKKVPKKLRINKDEKKITKSKTDNRKRKLKSSNGPKRKIPLIDDDY